MLHARISSIKTILSIDPDLTKNVNVVMMIAFQEMGLILLSLNFLEDYAYSMLPERVREALGWGCEAEIMESVVANRLDAILYSKETLSHITRVSTCAAMIASACGLPSWEAELIRKASVYHDVGKHDVPDEILNKPGPLTNSERSIMQTHSIRGWAYLLPSISPTFRAGALIARQHHERWDGSGYPDGLSGFDIHLYGRIVAVADVYDALTSERVYKKPWPIYEVIEHFNAMSGHLYDPKVVKAFLQLCSSDNGALK